MKYILSVAALLLAAAPAEAARKHAPAPATDAPAAAAATPTATDADWRAVDADNTLVIDTNKGRVIVELTPAVAPATVERLKTLTRTHLYDNLTFFRVIDDFMAQTGDPKNNGTGGSTLPDLKAEFTFRMGHDAGFAAVDHPAGSETGFIGALPVTAQPAGMAMLTADGKVTAYGMFCPGVIGMARAEAEDSGNSQFFLMRQEHAALDQKYTAFGRVVVGEGVVRSIKAGEPVPDPQDKMIKVQILADMPANQRPKVRVIDTRGAYFAALVKQAKAQQGDAFTLCGVEVAGEAK
jgi:peptidylprolyl isomerase